MDNVIDFINVNRDRYLEELLSACARTGYATTIRLTDVPANCSGDSLTDVSKVLSVWLQRIQ